MGLVVTLRAAVEEDCETLFEWANDPIVRQWSFSTAPIPRSDHEHWFRARLHDKSCRLFIAMATTVGPGAVQEAAHGAEAIGQVRLDFRDGDAAVVSLSISAPWRGRKCATPIIQAAVREAWRDPRIGVLHAFIKPANGLSSRAFARAGFDRTVDVTRDGAPAIRVSRAR